MIAVRSVVERSTANTNAKYQDLVFDFRGPASESLASQQNASLSGRGRKTSSCVVRCTPRASEKHRSLQQIDCPTGSLAHTCRASIRTVEKFSPAYDLFSVFNTNNQDSCQAMPRMQRSHSYRYAGSGPGRSPIAKQFTSGSFSRLTSNKRQDFSIASSTQPLG